MGGCVHSIAYPYYPTPWEVTSPPKKNSREEIFRAGVGRGSRAPTRSFLWVEKKIYGSTSVPPTYFFGRKKGFLGVRMYTPTFR